jgi:hypothetical protein
VLADCLSAGGVTGIAMSGLWCPKATNVGPWRTEPQKVSVTDQVVGKGGTALTSSVEFFETATVKSRVGLGAKGFIAAGAVFFRATDSRIFEHGTLWCGPVNDGKTLQQRCVRAEFEGYSLSVDPWPKSPLTANPPVSFTDPLAASAELDLESSPVDLIGPAELSVTITSVSKGYLWLALQMKKGDQTVPLGELRPNFDASGVATVPFWSHKLLLTRSGDGVRVSLADDADGGCPGLGRMRLWCGSVTD